MSDGAGKISTSGSYKVGFEVLGGYSFSFLDKLVGQTEAKVRFSNSKAESYGVDLFKEKYSLGIAYLQGYKVTEQFVPYLKLGVDVAKIEAHSAISQYIDGDTTGRVVYGVGAKYAFSENSVVGIEYTRATSGNPDTYELDAKSNTFSLTYSYHF